MTLYELTDDFLRLWEMADDPEVDEDVFFDTLEGLQGSIEEKADGYAKVMKELSGETDKLKAEIDRLQAKKKAIENNIDRMKTSLENAMIATGNTKFKTTLFSFGIQKNPASVAVLDESVIPDEYLIVQAPKIDKKAILTDLKAGKTVAGCAIMQTEGLRIR